MSHVRMTCVSVCGGQRGGRWWVDFLDSSNRWEKYNQMVLRRGHHQIPAAAQWQGSGPTLRLSAAVTYVEAVGIMTAEKQRNTTSAVVFSPLRCFLSSFFFLFFLHHIDRWNYQWVEKKLLGDCVCCLLIFVLVCVCEEDEHRKIFIFNVSEGKLWPDVSQQRCVVLCCWHSGSCSSLRKRMKSTLHDFFIFSLITHHFKLRMSSFKI